MEWMEEKEKKRKGEGDICIASDLIHTAYWGGGQNGRLYDHRLTLIYIYTIISDYLCFLSHTESDSMREE